VLVLKKEIFAVMLILMVAFGAVFAAAADPVGPDTITPTSKGRRADSAAKNISAYAGNVTELIISATTVTDVWQGYFGNITGTVVLDDANNKSMYAWQDLSPAGEIFAVRTASAVTWASIECADLVAIAAEEIALNITAGEKDGINETFNRTSTTDIYVGTQPVADCTFSQYLYENDAASVSSNFEELLLHDGTYMVYTAIINQDKTGYDNAAHDFQLMVPEDGHNGDTSTTNYYFYVELN
jgi:hypothetical protein